MRYDIIGNHFLPPLLIICKVFWVVDKLNLIKWYKINKSHFKVRHISVFHKFDKLMYLNISLPFPMTRFTLQKTHTAQPTHISVSNYWQNLLLQYFKYLYVKLAQQLEVIFYFLHSVNGCAFIRFHTFPSPILSHAVFHCLINFQISLILHKQRSCCYNNTLLVLYTCLVCLLQILSLHLQMPNMYTLSSWFTFMW